MNFKKIPKRTIKQRKTAWKSKKKFEIFLSNSNASFQKKNIKDTIKQRKTAKMSYI